MKNGKKVVTSSS